jgi:hypothetical protein
LVALMDERHGSHLLINRKALAVEIKIGVQNVNREIVLESNQTADEVAEVVSKAMNGGAELRLADSKGRQVIVPSGVLGYVEIGESESRRIGFGAL